MVRIGEMVERWMRRLHSPKDYKDDLGTDWGALVDEAFERNRSAHEIVLVETESVRDTLRSNTETH